MPKYGHNIPLSDKEIAKIVAKDKQKQPNKAPSFFGSDKSREAITEALNAGATEVVIEGRLFDMAFPRHDVIWIQCRENNGLPCAWMNRERLV